MFEKKDQPIARNHLFIKRIFRSFMYGLAIIIICLLIGMSGYHYFEKMNGVDSFVNASMILSGMGPMSTLQTNGGKIFAGIYALFSGIIFLVVMAIIFAPVYHRFMHEFHLEETKKSKMES
jgi:hypothetical protein